MAVRVWGVVEDQLIEIRTEPHPGAAGFRIEGLPRKRGRTTRDRVRAALLNSGLMSVTPSLTIRLDPNVRTGDTSQLDLPIALAVLTQMGNIIEVPWVFATARLGLDGCVFSPLLSKLPSNVTVVTVLEELVR